MGRRTPSWRWLCLALVLVLRRGGPMPRMLALLYCAAAVALGYALLQGTLEEQELYLLIVPSLLIIPVAATLLRGVTPARKWSAAGRHREVPWTAMMTTALVLALSLSLITCAQWLRRPDDGFAHLLSYMATHVPRDARVTAAAGSDDIAFYALAGQYNPGLWLTPAALTRNRVQYVLVEGAEINQGYSSLTRARVRYLVGRGRVLFLFHGRTYGDLELYRMPLPTLPMTGGKYRR